MIIRIVDGILVYTCIKRSSLRIDEGYPMDSTASLPQPAPVIPWKARDVWIGVACLALWVAFSFGVQALVYFLGFTLDLGVLLTFGEALMLLPVWLLALRKYHAGWDLLGLRRFHSGAVGIGCGLMVLFYIFNYAYNFLFITFLHLDPQGAKIAEVAGSSWSVLVWLGGVVVAPFAEEIFFRGFIFGGLEPRYGWKAAAGISALLFALLHLNWMTVLPIFLTGLIFAWLYHYSRSLWPSIIMHMLVNGSAFLLTYLLLGQGA
jgi:membrane protease YdiL (CAAX protease family)